MGKTRGWMTAVLAGSLVCSMLLGGCSKKGTLTSSVRLEQGTIQENSIVMKVGDIGVKYSEIRNYCYLMHTQYESSFGSELWDYALTSDSTIGDEAKEEIINMITQLKIICATAEEEKVSLTSDEKDEALQKAEAVIESASKKDKKSYALSVTRLSDIYEENALADKMFYIATDDADTEVTDEEARQVDIQYLEVMTKGTDKNGAAVDLDETEKAKAKEKAQTLLKQAKGSGDFLEFAKTNTDSSTTELVVGKDSDTLDAAVISEAMKLQTGAFSDVIETDSGYFIVYCAAEQDEDATYARREEIIEERQTNMFQKKYAKWLGEYTVNISQSFWKIFKI